MGWIMKYMKLIKRVLVLFMVVCIIFTTVFFSYNNTMIVNATEYSNLIFDAVCVAAASVGLVFSAPTAAAVVATLTPLLTQEGVDVYHYVTDNGDGTTTISEEFIQLTLQAYQDYIKENFDGTLNYNPDNGYYEYGPSVSQIDYTNSNFPCFSKFENSGFFYPYPVALLLYDGVSNGSGKLKYKLEAYFFNGNTDSADGGIFKVNDYASLFVKKPTCVHSWVSSSYSGFASEKLTGLYFVDSLLSSSGSLSISCPTIPVYTSYEFMKADLQSGKFTNAENYRMSGQTSMYTGSYGGGDITVQTEKLGNIEEKLDEINETDKSIDDKLKDLLDWLGIGDGPGSSGGIGAPSGWYEAVLAYLDSILSALEALVWIEADDSITGDRKDLFDLIDKIWEDPENGSQEAADAISGSFSDVARGLTKKFPFSIPWDIHALFTVFANAGNPQPAVVSYSAQPAVMSYSAEPALHYSDSGGIQAYTIDPEDLEQDAHNAPYFVLPLVIESWGINEQVVIDLKDFQTLSTLSRTLFSLLFAVFLIKFTMSVIKIYKGGSDD